MLNSAVLKRHCSPFFPTEHTAGKKEKECIFNDVGPSSPPTAGPSSPPTEDIGRPPTAPPKPREARLDSCARPAAA